MTEDDKRKLLAIANAIGTMALIRHFPADQFAIEALERVLGEMCSCAESATWLGDKMATTYGEWPGLSILRGVYCTRYKPADNVTVDLPASDPIFRETERRAIEKSDEHKKQLADAFVSMSEEALNMMEGWQELVTRHPPADEHKKQDKEWAKLCARYPVPRVFPTLSKEFATSGNARRAQILSQIEAKLASLPKSHI